MGMTNFEKYKDKLKLTLEERHFCEVMDLPFSKITRVDGQLYYVNCFGDFDGLNDKHFVFIKESEEWFISDLLKLETKGK